MRFAYGAILFVVSTSALAGVTTPKQFFGFDICDDYQLANYQQLTAYWQKLAKESGRIKLVSIGKTEEGREQWMAMISDPKNLRNADKIRRTAHQIAKAEFKSESDFWKTAKDAKTVVWIDGGLHANETLGAQQLIETAYQLVSREDDENKRILKDSLILLVHANPDGMDLVSDWYMRRKEPKERSLGNIPVLYQKYAGHDNNRDFYQMNLAETRNMNRILYREWFPQIVYNHHQSSPAGTIMYIPPFRNPFNYHVDPLVNNATDLVGTHMQHRLLGLGLGGTVSRDGASFSAWWNGGLRTTTYFHNMVGILTETWGSPNPGKLPWVTERQVPTTDSPKPIDIRQWHLKDSLKYEVEANYAILDYASRYRDRILYQVYRSALNSIERGSKDNWTRYPSRIRGIGEEALSKPELRDARYYVIPPAQPDASATQRFIELLTNSGVEVSVAMKALPGVPSGSIIVRAAQPYRPHVLDMFEPQDHPNDLQYPGGPPKPPYDNAGYTPAYTMGVRFDRILDARPDIDQNIALWTPNTLSQTITGSVQISRQHNDAFKWVNLAFKSGLDVVGNAQGFVVSGREDRLKAWQNLNPRGQSVLSSRNRDRDFEDAKPISKARIGLVDRFGGSMPSGWFRWLLDDFSYDYQVLFPPQIEKGNLRDSYDAIIVPSGLISATAPKNEPKNPVDDDPTVPSIYKGRWGSTSTDTVIAKLKEFAEQGGHLLVVGTSSLNFAKRAGLPVESSLEGTDGKPLKSSEFYIPGSVLRLQLTPHELTNGMMPDLDVLFDDSPALKPLAGVTFGTYAEKPLRSGWALGQEKLNGSAAFADVAVGKGRVVLYGPEVNFRGQTHASFKLIFNALERASNHK